MVISLSNPQQPNTLTPLQTPPTTQQGYGTKLQNGFCKNCSKQSIIHTVLAIKDNTVLLECKRKKCQDKIVKVTFP